KILDKKNHKALIFFATGLLISSVFQFFTAYAKSFTGVLLIRLAHTIGDMLAILEMDVLTSLFFPVQRIGGNSGIIFCTRTTAIFLWAYMSGYLNSIGGYGLTFIINGIMVFAFAVITLALIRKKF
ncbi:MAG: hypothetical protein V1753_02550, partial [Pseudomonadota bacterium]